MCAPLQARSAMHHALWDSTLPVLEHYADVLLYLDVQLPAPHTRHTARKPV